MNVKRAHLSFVGKNCVRLEGLLLEPGQECRVSLARQEKAAAVLPLHPSLAEALKYEELSEELSAVMWATTPRSLLPSCP